MNVPTAAAASLRAWSLPRLGQRTAALWLAYIALALVLAAPLLLVEVPMGVDTLNHLARIHVRAHIADDTDLARLFEVRDALVPYMGLDWLLTPMARVMPTLVAGRVFIVLLLWGMVGAVMAVQRAFTGRVGFGPLLVGLVSYNGLLAWGFLNYLLGMIGALLGLAAWRAMRSRPWGWRLLLFSGVTTALYFVHLLALALYAVMLVTYEVFGRPRPWRTLLWDWMVLGLQFVPAAALFFRLGVTLTGGSADLFWLWNQKPVRLASPFLFAGAEGGPDAGLAVLCGCAFLAIRLKCTGVLHWHRGLGVMAAVLAILGVVAPSWAFGVALVDLRFPFAAACLAAAAISVRPVSGKRLWPAGLAVAVATLVQAGSAAATMHSCDLQYAEVRAALQAVPRGEVLTAVEETEDPASSLQCTRVHIYEHMTQLMTLDRSGYSPDFFAQVTPVAVRDGRGTDTAPIRTHLLTPDMLPRHGYVLWMHFGNHDRPVPPGLSSLREGSFFTLYATQ